MGSLYHNPIFTISASVFNVCICVLTIKILVLLSNQMAQNMGIRLTWAAILSGAWLAGWAYTNSCELLITAARNRILSMKMLSSLVPALFQSCLTDTRFHTNLSMEIVQKPLSNLQKVCTLVACFSHTSSCHLAPTAKFSHDGMFTSSVPQANFFNDTIVTASRSKGLTSIYEKPYVSEKQGDILESIPN